MDMKKKSRQPDAKLPGGHSRTNTAENYKSESRAQARAVKTLEERINIVYAAPRQETFGLKAKGSRLESGRAN